MVAQRSFNYKSKALSKEEIWYGRFLGLLLLVLSILLVYFMCEYKSFSELTGLRGEDVDNMSIRISWENHEINEYDLDDLSSINEMIGYFNKSEYRRHYMNYISTELESKEININIVLKNRERLSIKYIDNTYAQIMYPNFKRGKFYKRQGDVDLDELASLVKVLHDHENPKKHKEKTYEDTL